MAQHCMYFACGNPDEYTFHPHCAVCGRYLLPCTTPNGIHPDVHGAGPRPEPRED